MESEKGATMTHGPPPAQPPVVAPPVATPVPIPVGFGEIHQSNPPLEQLPNLQFCLQSNPSWPEVLMLAFQHYIVMLGTIVMLASFLVPQMGGDHGDKARVIQTLLFMGGVNTLLQTLIGTRLPTVMNSSFVFIIPVTSIIRDFASRTYNDEHQRFLHTMRAIQGSLMISSFTIIFLGFTKTWERLFRFCSPVTIVPLVCVVGLGLFDRGFPQVGKCVEIGLPALLLLMLLITAQQYIKHNHLSTYFVLERFSIIFCVKVAWVFAAILTAAAAYNHVPEKTEVHCRTDRSHLISSAPWTIPISVGHAHIRCKSYIWDDWCSACCSL